MSDGDVKRAKIPVCSIHGRACTSNVLHTHDTKKPPKVWTCVESCKVGACATGETRPS